MQVFLYSILGSIIGVVFASFLTLKVEKAILKQNFKKDIYDQCLMALRASRQGILDLDAEIKGFSTIFKSVETMMKRLSDASTDKDKSVVMQEGEQRRADYGDQLRGKIHGSAELFVELHKKVSMYSFAFPKTQIAFQRVAEEYGAYLTEQNNFVDLLLSGDASTLFKNGSERQARMTLSESLGSTMEHVLKRYDEVENLLRHELIGGLFAIRN